MIANARIADLIRDNKPEEITEAIAEGDFFQMQTFSKALIELVLEEKVDREIAANAASNRHDFLIALDRAIKEQALAAHAHVDSGRSRDRRRSPAGARRRPARARRAQPEPSTPARRDGGRSRRGARGVAETPRRRPQ